MTDNQGTVGTATAAAQTHSGAQAPSIATAALLGAAERVLADAIGIPENDLQQIMHGMKLLARHLFGKRGQ